MIRSTIARARVRAVGATAAHAFIATAVLAFAAPLGAQAPVDTPLRDTSATTSLSADYGYSYFHGDIDPWHRASFGVGRRSAAGSIIARVNYANRFRTSGTQVEVDAYPRLTRHTYAYLNAGYSRSAVFPGSRFGAELFGSLPHAWETSFGVRQLRFGGVPVTLFTGAVGKYVGNSWISLRPTFHQRADGYSASASLTARKYFADADNYLGSQASYGSAPTDRLAPEEVLSRQSSWSAGVQGSRTLRPGFVTTASIGAESDGLGPNRVRRLWQGSVGLRLDLKRFGR